MSSIACSIRQAPVAGLIAVAIAAAAVGATEPALAGGIHCEDGITIRIGCPPPSGFRFPGRGADGYQPEPDDSYSGSGSVASEKAHRRHRHHHHHARAHRAGGREVRPRS